MEKKTVSLLLVIGVDPVVLACSSDMVEVLAGLDSGKVRMAVEESRRWYKSAIGSMIIRNVSKTRTSRMYPLR